MNPLDTLLKDKLKIKPQVQPNQGVKITITGPSDKDKQPLPNTKIPHSIKITAEKDNGTRALEIAEKIRQRGIREVQQKMTKEAEVIESKAPIVSNLGTKKKIKKIPVELVLKDEIEKDEEPLENLPQGGPRLDEQGLKEEQDLKEEIAFEEIIKKPRKRVTEKVKKGIIPLGPESMIEIGDTSLLKRLPPPTKFDVKVSSYYMNNREIFVNFINGLFETYKDDLLDDSKAITCDNIGKDTGEVDLLTHQKIVREYMNLFTPYRGLLLYHGLGSGKTCSSIAIAEGMKSGRKIIIMTPASLKRNYIEEIKKCGDLIYRKNQFWEWISIDNNASLANILSGALGLPVEYIKRNGGAWLQNITKPNNYAELSTSDKKVLNNQLDEMITNKYRFINYNGLRREKFKQLTDNYETNIFDNSVIIIDEAHNLISRIVNKINKTSNFSAKKRGPDGKLPTSLSLQLYEFLLRAENARVVLLTGTPIINYPNEIGILFNILRGYIKTWNFTLNPEGSAPVSKETLLGYFSKEKVLDYIDYIPSTKSLTITRNPIGFENKITASSGYKGVTNEKKEKRGSNGEILKDDAGKTILEDRGTVTDEEFLKRIVKLLKKNDINVSNTTFTVNTALPDTLDEFINIFIDKDTGRTKNIDKFKRRILGLTSYFRSAQEELLPKYDKNFDKHEVFVPMSDYQFKVYEDYRYDERKSEKPTKKKSVEVDADGLFKEPSSTYRIFSRLACNFAMPVPPGRPVPAIAAAIEFNKKEQKVFEWMKKKYYKHQGEYHEELNKRMEEFKKVVPEENMEVYNDLLIKIVQVYTKEMLTKDTHDSIEDFVKIRPEYVRVLTPYSEYLKQEEEKFNNVRAEINAEKAEKEAKKTQEKEAKKAEKEAKRAEEKAEKEAKKAEEKAEKEAKKAEEKERKRLEKEEEKERKKAEKAKAKGITIDELSDSDEDEDIQAGGVLIEVYSDDEDKPNKQEKGKSDAKDGENVFEQFVEKDDTDDIIILKQYKDEDAANREKDELEGDELLETMGDNEYKKLITETMNYLRAHKQSLLTPDGLLTYSPKFLAMLENIEDPEHPGLHLVYSQFRTMEGIGIFAITLEANGFSQFKIKRTGADGWEINMSEEEMGKPCYALYTGTEDAEEREIIRNIYNGAWDYIPNNIATQLRARSSNNNMGEIIKVLMITSAGSEGINLRNTRYVHIMEPYWHPVRSEQVIGRARRICSHQSLPVELQTVEVFIYIMVFTKKQLDSEYAIELKLSDTSKLAPFLPQSSDQKLYEISTIKEQLTSQLLIGIKEAAIDCATHAKSTSKEGITCLSFGQPTVQDFTYNPNYAQDENDTVAAINKVTIDWEAKPFTIKSTGKKYFLRMDTKQVYDYDSVIQAKQVPGVRPILLGKLVKNSKGEMEIVKEKIY